MNKNFPLFTAFHRLITVTACLYLKCILLAVILGMSATACCGEEKMPDSPQGMNNDKQVFAKGADVSWLTEMESAGLKFYNADGVPMECMALLKSLGLDAIRLRVWVNPVDGWCNKEDVLAKAKRAHDLGMRLMLDFHYSDVWADPASQYKPEAWKGLSLEQLTSAIALHTKDVLEVLKENGIMPEWVQVGNEVGPGMLWDSNVSLSGATYNVEKENGVVYAKNEANFAMFVTTGCRAVKQVFPKAKVIVHLQEGDNNDLYRWIFDMLEKNNAEYDVIGMSLYPEIDTWDKMTNACIKNMADMVARYDKDVMICEVGMSWDEAEVCKEFLVKLLKHSKTIDRCLGIFYWEPESYGGWKGYTKGAFDNSGRSTEALDAFKQ